jgi:hypothetical protein
MVRLSKALRKRRTFRLGQKSGFKIIFTASAEFTKGGVV